MESENVVKILSVKKHAESKKYTDIKRDLKKLMYIFKIDNVKIQKRSGYLIRYQLASPLEVTDELLHLYINLIEEILGPFAILEVQEELADKLQADIFEAGTECSAIGNVVYLEKFRSCRKL
jgi:hypothetical protein